MGEEKEEELGKELQLIHITKAVSELLDVFATSGKIVQHPSISLFQYSFGLYFTLGFPDFPLSFHDAEFCVIQEAGGRGMLSMAPANSFSTYRDLI